MLKLTAPWCFDGSAGPTSSIQSSFANSAIRYSTSASMAGAKYATTGKKAKSKKIGKLAKKTKYYVQVRTYTTYGGKTFYSNWSPVKSVVTK